MLLFLSHAKSVWRDSSCLSWDKKHLEPLIYRHTCTVVITSAPFHKKLIGDCIKRFLIRAGPRGTLCVSPRQQTWSLSLFVSQERSKICLFVSEVLKKSPEDPSPASSGQWSIPYPTHRETPLRNSSPPLSFLGDTLDTVPDLCHSPSLLK